MKLSESRLTGQSQVSVPAAVRRKLGIAPGSTIVWEERGEEIIIRRAGTYSSEEIHAALFPEGPPTKKTVEEMDKAIAEHMLRKHARR